MTQNIQSLSWYYNHIQMYVNIGLMKCGIQVMASWRLKKNASTQDVAHLNGDYMTNKKIPGHKNHHISILYLLLQVLDIIDCCAINSKI